MLKFTLIFLGVSLVLYLIYVFLPMNRIVFWGMEKQELAQKIEQDFSIMEQYIWGLEETMEEINSKKDIFEVKKLENLKEKNKREILELWVSFLDYQVALSKMVDDYKYFYQINYFFNRELHTKAFLIGYSSFLSAYKNGVQLIEYTMGNEVFEKLFNDNLSEYGIQGGMYDLLKWNVIHVGDILRLTAGYGNLKFLDSYYEKSGIKKDKSKLFSYLDEAFFASTQKMKKESVEWFPKNGIKIFKDKTYTVWFPVQKNVAQQMGKIRLTTRHENFISPEQIEEMENNLQPGDILLERRNWYLSNIGIPGFWPHAAIYIGTFEELESFFNDEVAKNLIREENLISFREALKNKNERFFNDYQNQNVNVIEAKAPGVILQTLEKSAEADYVGVLRPRLDKVTILKSLLSAFENYGKPYDYHFDFITDSALVCSELVYKTYKEYLNMGLISHAGKRVFTATNLVQKFDQEFGKDNQELDFVYFLEGREADKKAIISTLDDFRKTWLRPKWDIVQE